MVDLGVEWTVVYRTFAVALLTTFMVLHIKGENVEMEGGEDEEEEKEEEQFEWKEEENGKIDENNSNAADEAENSDLIMKEFFPTTMDPSPRSPSPWRPWRSPSPPSAWCSTPLVYHQEFPGGTQPPHDSSRGGRGGGQGHFTKSDQV